jgi:uncharacterized protein YndB with AHSA1/START domain
VVLSDEVRRIEVSRLVDAPAARIFAYLTNTENHPCFDTSGMVRASVDHAVLRGEGSVFVMDMYNALRGEYQVENHVVVYEPERVIGWAPAEPGHDPAGHTFVWWLTPVDDDRTLVTQTYDWSAFRHRDMLAYLPVVNRDQLRASLDRVAQAVVGSE